MATVRYIPNRYEDVVYEGENKSDGLIECVTRFAEEYPSLAKPFLGKKVVIRVNGKLLKVDEWELYDVYDDDIIEVTHTLEGRKTVGVILMIVGAVIFTVGIYTENPYLMQVGMGMMASGAYMYFFSPDLPMVPRDDASQTYSWDGPATSMYADRPIPVVYGKHLIGGQVLNYNLWGDGADNYVDILFGLGEGELNGLRDEDDAVTVSPSGSFGRITRGERIILDQNSFASSITGSWIAQGIAGGIYGVYIIAYVENESASITFDYATTGAVELEIYLPNLGLSSESNPDVIHKYIDNVNYEIYDDTTLLATIPGSQAYEWGSWLPLGIYNVVTGPVKVKIVKFVGKRACADGVGVVPISGVGSFFDEPYIKLNNTFIADFTTVHYAFKEGTNTQTSISSFTKTNTSYAFSTKVVTGPAWTPTYTTVGKVNEFSVRLEANTLYRGQAPATIHYRARYRVNDPPGSWVTTDWETVSEQSKSKTVRFITITDLDSDVYDIEVHRKYPESTSLTVSDRLDITAIVETTYNDLSYPNTALLGVRILASDELSGSFPNMTTLVQGIKVRVPDLQYSGSNFPFEDAYWDDDATQWKKISNDDVCTWDGTSYVTQYTSNPAYCIRDFLLNTRFGLGEFVTTSDIDEDAINATAKKCWQLVNSKHRNELNMAIDGASEPPSVLTAMARAGRIIMFWSGGYIKLKYEEDESSIQLFTMGNIKKDSFTLQYLPYSEIPNVIEGQFANSEQDYRMEVREVADETEWTSTKPKRKTTLSLVGITDEDQAIREIKFALNSAKYKRKVAEFTAPISAVHCEPGDIIDFQHDVPQWGWGGRVVSGTSTTLVMDQDVPTAVTGSPSSYDIKVIHNDDTIETFDLTAPCSGNTVTIDGTWQESNPAEDEVYLLGTVDSTIKEYRVVAVTLTPEEEIKLTITSHNAAIYSDTGIVAPTDDDTEIPDPSDLAADVTDLRVREVYDGLGFIVSFNKPVDYNWDHADIYLSTDGIDFFKIASSTTGSDYVYRNVIAGQTYYIRVYSVNKIGLRTNTYLQAGIAITEIEIGDPLPPSGLEILGQGNNLIFSGRDCVFTWRRVVTTAGAGALDPSVPVGATSTIRIQDFKIEIYRGTFLIREEYTPNTLYTYTWEKNAEDNGGIPMRNITIKVYQRSEGGNISLPAELSVVNSIPDMTAIVPTLTTSAMTVRVDFSNYNTADTDLHHYDVYYGNATPLNASHVEISKTTKFVTIGQLPQEIVYYFQVEPYDMMGAGEKSQVASVVVSALPDGSVTGAQIIDPVFELELYKINFQYISWGQFAVFDDFNDEDKRASPDPSTYDARVYLSKIDNNRDWTADKEFGFVSKTYTDITVVASGNSATTGSGYLVDEEKDWWANEHKNLLCVDDTNATFNIASNTATRLIVASNLVASDYYVGYLRDDSTSLGTQLSFNCGTQDTNRLLVVVAGIEELAEYLTGVQVDGKACTLVATAYNSNSPGNCQEMWYIDENGLTTSEGVVTIGLQGATTPLDWALSGRLYIGVDQSGLVASGIENTVTASTVVAVENIDVPTDGLVVMGVCEGGGSLTVDNWTSPLTREEKALPNSAGLYSACATEPSGASSKTYALTFTTDANRGTGIVGVWDNASTTLLEDTPSTGVYKLRDDNPQYAIAFCTFADSTQGDEYGYVKLEASFDNGGNYQTFLDTENSINLLGGTVLVADSGNDYIVRITLKNDGAGDGPEVYGFLIGTDPSPWRF